VLHRFFISPKGNMIFFTADTHFWHFNIIALCNRPSYRGWMNREEALASMNKMLIDNWNSVIKPDDQVYHLGDFAFAGTGKCQEIFDQLRGKKFLIRGNHDGKSQCKVGWEWVKDYYRLMVEANYEDKETGRIVQYHHPIILMHYPILSWDGMANGSWHLHGHCHGSLADNGSLRLDVGVDGNNYAPVSLTDIRNRMVMRTVVPIGDHHHKELP